MFDIQEELKKLPEKPGVYIMKDKDNNILYIGKAIVLKNRVRQYFQGSSRLSPRIAAMVSKVYSFEYIVTDSELEAFILECNLIKKHRPKYNILLKDDKTYPYIKVTMNEEYPRILITRRLEKDGAKYFGPYSNATAVRETVEFLKKIFPIKSCNKVLPRDIGKGRPCLNYHIYKCLGPCKGDIDKDEYREVMKDICSFLSGKQEDIIKKLEKKMEEASENLQFEKAAVIRDRIKSLEHIAEKQKVLSTTDGDRDVIASAKNKTDACIQIFFIRNGKLIGREHFIFEGEGDADNKELLASFMKQFYNSDVFIPAEILLQDEIDEVDIFQKWLSDKKGSKVHIRVPKRGDKLELVEMVSQNAEIALNQHVERAASEESHIREGLLYLNDLPGVGIFPSRIEAYDISNTGISEIVGSMVVFESGKPDNKEYRKFRIKSVKGQDDYASMQEIIHRRFLHAKREQEELGLLNDNNENDKVKNDKAKFSKMPSLILIDGGLGHVKAVLEVLNSMELSIPVLGMVKDENHRTRGLISPDGNEYNLTKNIQVLRFITSIQDEAHRFALSYNKKLREKRYKGSVLDEIKGIGPKKKKALIKHFGSVSATKKAGIDDLAAVEGISIANAKAIYEYFNG